MSCELQWFRFFPKELLQRESSWVVLVLTSRDQAKKWRYCDPSGVTKGSPPSLPSWRLGYLHPQPQRASQRSGVHPGGRRGANPNSLPLSLPPRFPSCPSLFHKPCLAVARRTLAVWWGCYEFSASIGNERGSSRSSRAVGTLPEEEGFSQRLICGGGIPT